MVMCGLLLSGMNWFNSVVCLVFRMLLLLVLMMRKFVCGLVMRLCVCLVRLFIRIMG